MKKHIIFNDIILITPDIFDDKRGFFLKYIIRKFEKLGINIDFIQDNFSFSENANTLRGIHFQSPPFAQSKLIRVVSGSIFDVFIDLRKDSKTYEQYGSFNLNPDDGWIFIPKGFAHGFCNYER